MLPREQATFHTRHIRNIQVGVFLLSMGIFIDYAQDFLLPVVLGTLIAMAFRPSIRVLARHRIPEWLAATGFISAVTFSGVVLAYFILVSVSSFVQNAPYYAQVFGEKLRDVQGSVKSLLRVAEDIQAATGTESGLAVQEVVIREGPPFAYLSQVTGYSVGVIATIVLTLVFAAFLMASGDLFYTKLVRVLPTLQDKKTALGIVYDVEREVSSYLLTVTGINACLGIAVGISFQLLGMPTPFL